MHIRQGDTRHTTAARLWCRSPRSPSISSSCMRYSIGYRTDAIRDVSVETLKRPLLHTRPEHLTDCVKRRCIRCPSPQCEISKSASPPVHQHSIRALSTDSIAPRPRTAHCSRHQCTRIHPNRDRPAQTPYLCGPGAINKQSYRPEVSHCCAAPHGQTPRASLVRPDASPPAPG